MGIRSRWRNGVLYRWKQQPSRPVPLAMFKELLRRVVSAIIFAEPSVLHSIIEQAVEREVSSHAQLPAMQAASSSQKESDMELLPVVTSIFRATALRNDGRRRASFPWLQLGRRSGQTPENHGTGYSTQVVPRTTESRHSLGYSPNLILDFAEPSVVDQLWVGDITYIPVASVGFCYLSTLMIDFPVVGWSS